MRDRQRDKYIERNRDRETDKEDRKERFNFRGKERVKRVFVHTVVQSGRIFYGLEMISYKIMHNCLQAACWFPVTCCLLSHGKGQ